MRSSLFGLLILALSCVAGQSFSQLRFNGAGIIISNDTSSIDIFRNALKGTPDNAPLTILITFTLNAASIQPTIKNKDIEQTLFSYAAGEPLKDIFRICLVNVQDKSFQIRVGWYGASSTIKKPTTKNLIFTDGVVGKQIQIMVTIDPIIQAKQISYSYNGYSQLETSDMGSTSNTWTALTAMTGAGEIRMGGNKINATGGIDLPFYGTLEQISFHGVSMTNGQFQELYAQRDLIASPNQFLSQTNTNKKKFAPNGGYYQFKPSGTGIDTSITFDNNGVYTFTGQSYTDLTSTATKSIITAKSLGCDKPIQQQLTYALLGSTFTCPTPTSTSSATTQTPTTTPTPTPTNAVTDSPTSTPTPTPTSATTTQTPTTPTPTNEPTSATTSPPTTPVTDAPTTTPTPTPTSSTTTQTPVTDAPTPTPTPTSSTTTQTPVTDAPTSSTTPTPTPTATTVTPTTPTNTTDSPPTATPTPTPTTVAPTLIPNPSSNTSSSSNSSSIDSSSSSSSGSVSNSTSSTGSDIPTEDPNQIPTDEPTEAAPVEGASGVAQQVSNGLSNATKVAIIVPVVVGTIILVLVLIAIYYCIKRRNNAVTNTRRTQMEMV